MVIFQFLMNLTTVNPNNSGPDEIYGIFRRDPAPIPRVDPDHTGPTLTSRLQLKRLRRNDSF